MLHNLHWVRRHFGVNLNRYLVQLRTVTLSIWINQNLTYKIIDRKSDLNDRLDSDHCNIFYIAQMKIHEHSLCMITDPIVCQAMTGFIRRINKLYVIGKKLATIWSLNPISSINFKNEPSKHITYSMKTR